MFCVVNAAPAGFAARLGRKDFFGRPMLLLPGGGCSARTSVEPRRAAANDITNMDSTTTRLNILPPAPTCWPRNARDDSSSGIDCVFWTAPRAIRRYGILLIWLSRQ